MKISTPIVPLALLASSSMASFLEGLGKRAADNCLRAIRGTPSVGLPFCSSALSISKVTSTSYVAAPTVTVVVSATSTSVTTTTTTTATATITAAMPNAKNKRRTDQTAVIYSMCKNDPARISSACSQFLSGVATATTTILSTITPTLLRTASTTITQTSTLSTGALTTVTPLPIIANPGFDDATNPIRGWTASSELCDGCLNSFSVVSSSSLSFPNSFHVHTATNTGYISLSQPLNLVLGTKYTFSFSYRVDKAVSTNAAIQVFVSGGVSDTIYGATSAWQQYGSGVYTAGPDGGEHPTLLLAIFEQYAQGPEDIYVDSLWPRWWVEFDGVG